VSKIQALNESLRLLWGSVLAIKERQRAERLAQQLRAAGIESEE
jgi:hypothetical protein